MEQDEEVSLVGFSLELDDEPQDNQDDQDDQEPNQVQDEPIPRETVVNCGRDNREHTQQCCNPERRIVWNPRNHAGWVARPRPRSMGRS